MEDVVQAHNNRAKKIALGSILIAVVVIGLKYAAWRMTGSVALYSDALESVVNLIAAAAALWAIRLADKPADDEHNFGHHKAEYLSAVFEGALVAVAALLILHSAGTSFWQGPEMPSEIGAGLTVNGLAAVLNGAWAAYLLRAGRQLRSPALLADGQHLISDVVTSFGVIFGLVLATLTGWAVLDPVMASLVALNVLWQGWKVISSSLNGLMDRAPDIAELELLRATIEKNLDEALQYHDLKARVAGRAMFVDLHLVVNGTMSVHKSHEICDSIEAAIRREISGAVIQIHVEPERKAKVISH